VGSVGSILPLNAAISAVIELAIEAADAVVVVAVAVVASDEEDKEDAVVAVGGFLRISEMWSETSLTSPASPESKHCLVKSNFSGSLFLSVNGEVKDNLLFLTTCSFSGLFSLRRRVDEKRKESKEPANMAPILPRKIKE